MCVLRFCSAWVGTWTMKYSWMSRARRHPEKWPGLGHGPRQSSLWPSERAGRGTFPRAGLRVQGLLALPCFWPPVAEGLWAPKSDLPSPPLRTQVRRSSEERVLLCTQNGVLFEMDSLGEKKSSLARTLLSSLPLSSFSVFC